MTTKTPKTEPQPSSILRKIVTGGSHMKVLFTVLAVLALCAGCDSKGKVVHTTFFTTHDPHAYFESVARDKGFAVRPGGLPGGGTGGNTYKEKHFEIWIKGDRAFRDTLIRDTLIQRYMVVVEKELIASGVTMNGGGVSGQVENFDFKYHRSGTGGVIRVTSEVDLNGFIQVDVFLYEHN